MSTPYEEAYAAQQLLLILGFSSNDVYVGCVADPDHRNVLTVALRTQGKEFRIAIHNMGDSTNANTVNARWYEFASKIASGKMSDEYLTSISKSARFGTKEYVSIIRALLISKGFVLPSQTVN